jgi:uncharacterized membrane protein (DUF373 family)
MSVESYADRSEQVMKWLELAAAYFLVALFAIGVFDLGLSLWQLLISGEFTDPDAVIDLIDTTLLLLIIVEVYQTVIAFSRDEPVVRIVINAALIAIARKVISYRISEFSGVQEAFVAAGAYAMLLAVLIVSFYVMRRVEIHPSAGPDDAGGKSGTDADGPANGPEDSPSASASDQQ